MDTSANTSSPTAVNTPLISASLSFRSFVDCCLAELPAEVRILGSSRVRVLVRFL